MGLYGELPQNNAKFIIIIVTGMIELWSEFLSYEPLPELMQGAFVALFSLFSAFAIGILFQIALSSEEFFGQEIYTMSIWQN